MKTDQDIIQAKPVSVDGINFRSTLEADWYSFFKLGGLEPEYEPAKFQSKTSYAYHPDFFIKKARLKILPTEGGEEDTYFHKGVYVEVKDPTKLSDEKEMGKIVEFSEEHPIILVSGTPFYNKILHHIDYYREDIIQYDKFNLLLSCKTLLKSTRDYKLCQQNFKFNIFIYSDDKPYLYCLHKEYSDKRNLNFESIKSYTISVWDRVWRARESYKPITDSKSIKDEELILVERMCKECKKYFNTPATGAKLCDDCYRKKYSKMNKNIDIIIEKRRKGICQRYGCNERAIKGQTFCLKHQKHRKDMSSAKNKRVEPQQLPMLQPQEYSISETSCCVCDINYENLLKYTTQEIIDLRNKTQPQDRKLSVEVLENEHRAYGVKIERVRKIFLS